VGNYADLLKAEQEQGQATGPKVATAMQAPHKARSPHETQADQKHGSTEPRKFVSMEPQKRGSVGSSSKPFRFDTAGKAVQKYTLAFTDEELEAMEDVKLELRRRHALKTSKVELVRCGLWDLIEDYKRTGEQSRLIQRLKIRKHGTT
jgi:hypothetical protein